MPHVSPRCRPLALAVVLLLGVGGLALPSAAAPARGTAAEEAAIRAVLRDQVQAWNRGDLEGFMAAYWGSDSLTFYSGGDISYGWRMAHDRYQRRYQGEGREMGALAFEIHAVEVLAKDAALVKGGWALTMKDGAPRGLFTLVMRRVRGAGWRVAHDHTSVATAP